MKQAVELSVMDTDYSYSPPTLLWDCEHTKSDKIRNDDIWEKVGVALIEDKKR